MSKEKLPGILIFSIILNLIFGGMLINNTYRTKKQSETNFYNCCRSISYVYDDLDYKLFKSSEANLKNSDYIHEAVSDCNSKLLNIDKMITELSKENKKISTAANGNMTYPINSYLWSLTDKVKENKALTEKDIANLKEIITKGKQFYSFVDSAPNYNSKYDPETPMDKIAKLNKEITKLCEDGKK